jgi:hypothetical protein
MEMKFYVAPEVELVEVAVEAGFATSDPNYGGGIGGGNGWA